MLCGRGAGTALTDLKTAAKLDGAYVALNGQKRWMSGGGHSDMIVFARMSPDAGAKVGVHRRLHDAAC